MTFTFSEDIRPQDDFFGWANQPWIDSQVIPEDRASWGSFEIVRDQAEHDVHELVEICQLAPDESDPDAKKIGALYHSFMDELAIVKRGLRPLHEALNIVDNVRDLPSFLRITSKAYREGAGTFMNVYVWLDAGDPSHYVVHASQGGLGLPDESYYREDKHLGVRRQYRQHLQNMCRLTKLGRDPQQFATNVFTLETNLAALHWDKVANRDAVKTYNPFDAQGLDGLFEPFTECLGHIGIPEHGLAKVIVAQPSFFEGMAKLLANATVWELRDWLTWRIIRSRANYLTEDIVEESFDFYSRKLHGVETIRDRWKRGIGLVEGILGDAVGRLYVDKHYQQSSREQMDELITHLLDAYRERITNLPWMQPETRERALLKLSQFTPKVGFPKVWRDYSALHMESMDLFGNLARAREFELNYEVGRLTREIDKDEWLMYPQTVNAYYSPVQNEIVFPAAILQPPFFSPARDAAYNYGAIGAVIGHEIGHGFDDQGSQYDGTGQLTNWWTDADRAAFTERTQQLVDQYEGLIPRRLGPDSPHHVNGKLTLGENIGDLGGLGIAYVAFEHYLQDHPEANVEQDGYTAIQRFFIGWVLSWRSFMRDERAINLLTVDPHSPDEFRANIVRNVDAWYEAFDVQPGDAMWIDPSERVSIW